MIRKYSISSSSRVILKAHDTNRGTLLQTILDSNPAGVVLVSFGSSIKPSQMTEEKMKVFLETFSRLSYTVIWKWDGEVMSDLPSNVILQTWLPQQDLLAHHHLKVFVTHGGLLSLQETLYHSTPIVGIPLGNDQKPNMMRAERSGYAVMLDWPSLNTETSVAAIIKATSDQQSGPPSAWPGTSTTS